MGSYNHRWVRLGFTTPLSFWPHTSLPEVGRALALFWQRNNQGTRIWLSTVMEWKGGGKVQPSSVWLQSSSRELGLKLTGQFLTLHVTKDIWCILANLMLVQGMNGGKDGEGSFSPSRPLDLRHSQSWQCQVPGIFISGFQGLGGLLQGWRLWRNFLKEPRGRWDP